MTTTTFVIALVILLITLVGGFWFIRSGKWTWIKEHLFTPAVLYIPYIKFCEDKCIRYGKLAVARYCCEDKKGRKGWHLIHVLLIKTWKKTERLPIHDRSTIPIDFFNILTPGEQKSLSNSNMVLRASMADIEQTSASDAARSTMMITLSIIALLGAIIFIAFACFNYWQNGSVL